MDPRSTPRRFADALALAAETHAGQLKRRDVPYIAHLLAVAAIVIEYGGDEDQAIAALLHDSVEDHGVPAADDRAAEPVRGNGADHLRQRIRAAFGDRVVAMVDDCTDTDARPRPSWRQRKRLYLAHLPEAGPDSLVVSMADKLDNASAIVRDLRQYGAAALDRFNAPAAELVWYYRALVDAFAVSAPRGRERKLFDELRSVVAELEVAIRAVS